MPGLISLPDPVTRWRDAAQRTLKDSRQSSSVHVHRSASSLPHDVWEAFDMHPTNANIMDAHALKRLREERSGQMPLRDELWLVFRSAQPTMYIDFILSCTNGPLGAYPIFIFTPHEYESLDEEFVRPRISRLVRELLHHVPVQRVYSVFAPEPVSQTFAMFWSMYTGIAVEPQPYYAALISYCTPQTFKNKQMTLCPDFTYELRQAVEADIPAAAELCHGFAAEAEPFVLTPERALEEAAQLVQKGQLWVCLVQWNGSSKLEIASIVAVTRTNNKVAAITKVFTNPKWRKRRCAERLVRGVCQQLLRERESVVLYVAHDNPAASKVYDRVGFLGLKEHDGFVKGVDPWLEIGFDRENVVLGHW